MDGLTGASLSFIDGEGLLGDGRRLALARVRVRPAHTVDETTVGTGAQLCMDIDARLTSISESWIAPEIAVALEDEADEFGNRGAP